MTKTKHKALLNKESLLSKRKEATIALIALLLIILFAQPLHHVLEAVKVISFLSGVKSGERVVLAFSLLMLVFFGYWLDRMRKGYVPTLRITLLLLGASFLFLFRDALFEGYPEPLRFSDGAPLSFLHAIYLLLAGQVLLYVNHWTGLHKAWKRLSKAADTETKPKEKSSEPHEGFYCDEPLAPNGKDEFGYRSYANRITAELLKTRSEQAFAVGINGKWGSGKTSFMNLMKDKLEGEDIITIDFDPWNSQTPAAIVQDYFAALRKALAPYHGEIADELGTYARSLTRIDNSLMSRSLQAILPGASENGDTRSLMEQVKQSIREIGKQIFIFIDDTDRLDKNEVFEVLRVIRNTGNLPGLMYVVGYDREYLKKSISHVHNSQSYLEKIFQLEVMLPIVEKSYVEKQYKVRLLTLGDKYRKEIEALFKDYDQGVRKNIGAMLETVRDCNRLINMLKINFFPVREHILLYDTAIVQSLDMKFPEIMDHFFRNNGSYVTVEKHHYSREHRQYQLKSQDGNVIRGFSEKGAHQNSALFEALNDPENSFELNDYQAEQISRILFELFNGGSLMYDYERRTHHSIKNPLRFNLYARHSLGERNLSWQDFIVSYEEGLESMKAMIEKNIEQGVDWELEQVFALLRSFDNREDFEKVISAQLYLCRRIRSIPILGWGLSGSVSDNIIEKIGRLDESFIDTFYQGMDEFQNAMIDWFRNGLSETDGIMDDLICKARKKAQLFDFYFDADALTDLSIMKLSQVITGASEYNEDLWTSFYYTECYKKVQESDSQHTFTESRTYPVEAKQLMQEIILEKYPREFALNSIRAEPRNEKIYHLNQNLLDVFESWEDFHNKFKKANEFDEKLEFLQFLEKLKKEKYRRYVEFPFDKIKQKVV